MLRYAARRVLLLIPTLLLIYTIVFVLIRATPGGPWDIEKQLPPEVLDNLARRYGLDRPLHEQYLSYLERALLHGDLGPSYSQSGRDVTEILGDFLPVSLQLGFGAMVIAFVAGVPLGILSAVRRNTWIDHAAMFIAMVGVSVPNFVTASVLILIFALGLHWLPTSGWAGLFSREAIIPLVALSLPALAAIARYSRSAMLEVIHQDYLRTARAKGLRERTIIYRHALRNALIPVITVTAVYLAFAVTGSFFVETIAGVPGIGRYFVNSISARDYPVIMATVLLFAVVVAILNLLTDLAYAALDPQIRYR